MGKFRLPCSPHGDLTIEWDSSSDEDCKVAKDFFDKQIEKGSTIVMVVDGKMKKVTEFDRWKEATQMLVIPKVKHGC